MNYFLTKDCYFTKEIRLCSLELESKSELELELESELELELELDLLVAKKQRKTKRIKVFLAALCSQFKILFLAAFKSYFIQEKELTCCLIHHKVKNKE